MHEVSIAMSLAEAVSERALQENVDKVNTVHVRIGAFAGVLPDALLFAWDIAVQGTVVEGARLLIENVPLVVFCPICDEAKTISGPAILQCPTCGTLTPTIVRGRELQLLSFEVADAVATH